MRHKHGTNSRIALRSVIVVMGSKASFPCNRLIVDRVDHVSKLSTDLKCLLNDSGSDMSDVVFLVQNQRFECHRVLLAARCSYFKAMLYGGMRESQPHVEIELPDATADAFRLLLEYVYTGCLELSSLREEVCPTTCLSVCLSVCLQT